jgi:hypothetical protein
MGDINEIVTIITKKTWDRSHKVTIDNTYGSAPSIQFDIQTASTENGEFKGAVPKGFINVTFDPTEIFPLLNPLDDSVIDPNGGNHALIHIVLYSLFKHKIGAI